jgi:hypothetical protein
MHPTRHACHKVSCTRFVLNRPRTRPGPGCLQDPDQRHMLDRKSVTEVVCAQCDTRQPTSSACISCGSNFGAYSCLRCNFFDDDLSKQQYHCDECGICRVGGREHYFHCRTCNCCYATSLRDSHVCIENSMHHNCPVCFEYLFESIKPINVMPCGHTIHQASRSASEAAQEEHGPAGASRCSAVGTCLHCPNAASPPPSPAPTAGLPETPGRPPLVHLPALLQDLHVRAPGKEEARGRRDRARWR